MAEVEKAVIDTNVIITANDHSVCARNCARRLEQLKLSGKIVLDDNWHILKEYGRHLTQTGQPGSGSLFYRWVLTNRENPERVEYHTLHHHPENPGEFAEFPSDPNLTGFHLDDRKFAALAVVSDAPVWNAVDSDWWNFRQALEAYGILIEFLCPEQFMT